MVSRQRKRRYQQRLIYEKKKKIKVKKNHWNKIKDEINLKRRQSYQALFAIGLKKCTTRTLLLYVKGGENHTVRILLLNVKGIENHTVRIQHLLKNGLGKIPSPIKKRVLRRYQNNLSPFKKQSKRAYYADIITVDHSDVSDMLKIPSLHGKGQNTITDSIEMKY